MMNGVHTTLPGQVITSVRHKIMAYLDYYHWIPDNSICMYNL